MPIYQYKAYAAGGSTTTGVIDADTPRDARIQLRRDNVLVSEIHELKGGRKKKKKQGEKADKVSFIDQLRSARAAGSSGPSGRNLEIAASITRQLGTLLNAGIPLSEALNAIIEQAETRKVEMVFRRIRERITQGASLGDAFADHPQFFSEMYVNMVRAGEATGRVDQVLSRLADFMQRSRALQRKVVTALTYPVMMIILGVVVVTILMTAVVPKITGMLLDTGKELPLPTQILMDVSDLFSNYWWAGMLIIAAVSAIVERYYKTDKGNLKIDKILIGSPLLGDLLRKSAVARWAHTLSTLLESGVSAVQSLEITQKVVGNRVVADATAFIRTRILEGTDIATPLKSSGAFPSVVGYMVSVGEKSGELEVMLKRIAESYDEEIEVVTERFTTVLEPIMIVVLATVVGFIVYSIVLPILDISSVA
ncbi:MAG: general secretion pathway protein F [Planctomycetota bacterium]|jgi:general secretion pathway protein F